MESQYSSNFLLSTRPSICPACNGQFLATGEWVIEEMDTEVCGLSCYLYTKDYYHFVYISPIQGHA